MDHHDHALRRVGDRGGDGARLLDRHRRELVVQVEGHARDHEADLREKGRPSRPPGGRRGPRRGAGGSLPYALGAREVKCQVKSLAPTRTSEARASDVPDTPTPVDQV